MPRKTQKRVTGRPQVDSSITSAGLVVAARPTSHSAPRTMRQPTIDPSTRAVVAGLGALNSAVNRMTADAVQKQAKVDYKAGQAARLTATQEDLKNVQAAAAIGTPNYQRGYLYQHGMSRAAEQGAALEAQYETNKDAFVSPGQFDKWMGGILGSEIEGLEGDALEGYLESMSRTENKLRQLHARDSYLSVRQSSMDDFNTSYRSEMNDAMEAGASNLELKEIERKYQDLGKVMEFDRSTINELTFETLREGAITYQRPDIFGDPETGDRGFWDLESTDVDDPERVIPGLANSPKWQKTIFDAQTGINNSLSKGQGTINQRDKFNVYEAIDKALDNGNPELAKRIAEERGLDSGLLSASETRSVQKDIQKRYDAQVRKDTIGVALTNGRAADLEFIGATLKEKQTAYNDLTVEMLMAAGDDPVKRGETLGIVIAMGEANGLKNEWMAGQMNNAPASSPEAFLGALALHRQAQDVSPNYAATLVNETRAAQFALYESMVHFGMNPEEAMAVIQESDTMEGKQAAKEFMGRGRAAHEQAIDDALAGTTSAPWFGLDADAGDGSYIQQEVRKGALTMMAMSQGRISATAATEWAIKRFEETHTAIRTPEGDETFYVYNGGQPLPEDYAETQEFTSERLQKLTEGTRFHDASGYFFMPDKNDPERLNVFGLTNRTPAIGPDGKPLSLRKGEVFAKYRTRDQLSPEEAQAQHAERQARRVEGGKSRKRKREESKGVAVKSQAESQKENKAARDKLQSEELEAAKQRDKAREGKGLSGLLGKKATTRKRPNSNKRRGPRKRK